MNQHNHANPNEMVVALDIGTTKVCALAGFFDQHGKLQICGFGKVESEGVMRGVVSNIDKTVKAIKEAIAQAEKGARTKFSEVHVGIAGQHIKSMQHRGMLTRRDIHSEISKDDIRQLIDDMHKIVLPAGEKIIHVIPQEYTVDGEQGIVDPIGMSGVRLEANFHIITGQITATQNILKCVERAGLQVASLTLEPIASATAVLTDEEKEAGVALVDIGGGTTDITVFRDGIIRHTAVIPLGGNVITKDIREGCNVMQDQAEKLKIKFGSALAAEVYENRIITIPGLAGRDPKEISEKNLAHIIQARCEEILEYVMWEIQRSGFDNKLIAGIVLTGGGASLRHIDKLTAYLSGLDTRIGVPVKYLAHGFGQQLNSPMYATAIGLLIKGIAESAERRQQQAEKAAADAAARMREAEQKELELEGTSSANGGSSWLDRIIDKTKEWFQADYDPDL